MALEGTSSTKEGRVTGVLVEHLTEGQSLVLAGNETNEAAPDDLSPQGLLHLQGLLHHRVRQIAWHIPWYGFKTQARLALDAGLAPSTVSRLLRGVEAPSLAVALRLTGALSKRLGRPLDVGHVFSLDGLYDASVCELASCRSCQAPTSYDRDDNFLPEVAQSGQWVRPLAKKKGR